MTIELQLNTLDLVLIFLALTSSFIAILDLLNKTNLTNHLKTSPEALLTLSIVGFFYPLYSDIEDQVPGIITVVLLGCLFFYLIAGGILEKKHLDKSQ